MLLSFDVLLLPLYLRLHICPPPLSLCFRTLPLSPLQLWCSSVARTRVVLLRWLYVLYCVDVCDE